MGDSDDDFDKKRRDKFQGERGENYRDRRKDDDWGRSRMRSDYRDRYSYQNDMPPAKRMRYENEDIRGLRFQPSYNNFNVWTPEPNYGSFSNTSSRSTAATADVDTQPPIMSFKAFLQTQDDNITDEEAIAKYAEYKMEFRRQQLNEFFVAHKEEEWFKWKYHPEESQKRKDEHLNALKKRANIFLEMLEKGKIDAVRVDADQGDAVVKLLDSVVIRLEGGTDLDLTVLDLAENVEKASKDTGGKGAANALKDATKLKAEEEKKQTAAVAGMKEKVDGNKVEGEEESEKKDGDVVSSVETKEGSNDIDSKREDNHSKEMDVNGSKDSLNEETEFQVSSSSNVIVGLDQEEVKGDDNAENKLSSTVKDESGGKTEHHAPNQVRKDDKKAKMDGELEDQGDEVVPLTPRALHKTSSIFLRTISPRITKAEIETICKKYPGFLRVSLSEPQTENHWFRRGWVTFRRDVNIKEICWNINNIRVRDCEMGAIVNRDLSRRVRSVSGLSAHKQVVLHDLKLCARLIQVLDARYGLWQDVTPPEEGESSNATTSAATVTTASHDNDETRAFGLVSGNPILKDITEFLVEEASAEEEELLGQVVQDESKNRHSQALKVLDQLLLYLRIVYSVDFYNMTQYASEDEMPNRCGIMHLRGMPSTTEVPPQEVTDYCEQYRNKLEPLMKAPEVLPDSELSTLGAKSEEVEVEKFIQANTQELAKDKWLCPLSGKKFKGAQFVRKHIFNKFENQLNEVKKEVEYFNNYLRDPKRPQLAEHPGNRAAKKEPLGGAPDIPPLGGGVGFHGGGGFGGGFGGPSSLLGGGGGYKGRGSFGVPFGGGLHPFSRGGRGGFPRGGRSMEYRPLITYRDLDAPCEPDEII